MKTIGLIGGLSWESSAQYYRLINQGVRERRGGSASASIVMHSFDFAQIHELQSAGGWDRMGDLLAGVSRNLERSGAEALLLCTNTMHKLADRITDAVGIPFLHIGDALADRLAREGVRQVGLLGTRFTMEEPFYAERLRACGIAVSVPPGDARADIHRVIFDELCCGRLDAGSRARFREIIADLANDGAEAIALACTEIMLLVGADDSPVPVFDTTAIHAQCAVDFALA